MINYEKKVVGKHVFYLTDEGWETARDIASRIGLEKAQVHTRIEAGVPLDVDPRSLYCVGGPHDGEWLMPGQIKDMLGGSRHTVNRRTFGKRFIYAPIGKPFQKVIKHG